MGAPRSRLRDWLQASHEEIERYERLLDRDDLPSERFPYLKRQLAREVELLAITDLLLDENDPQRHFSRSARLSFDGVVEGRKATGKYGTAGAPGLWRALRSAYLADDTDLLDAVHDEITTLPTRYPDRFPELAPSYHRLRAVDAFLDGDEETATEQTETMRRHVEAQELDGSSTTVLEGFVDEEQSVIESGIRGLCDFQRTQVPDDPDERIRGDGLSRTALFFLSLAADQGYEIDVDDEPLLALPPWRTTT